MERAKIRKKQRRLGGRTDQPYVNAISGKADFVIRYFLSIRYHFLVNYQKLISKKKDKK